MGKIKTNCCQSLQASPPPTLPKKKGSSSIVIFSFAIIGCFEQGPVGGQSSSNGYTQSQPTIIQKTIGLNEYTIQVGSFSNKKEAYWEAGRLRASRINNFVLQSGDKWLVCVGRYLSERRAQRMAETLRKQGIENPVVLFPSRRTSKPPPSPPSFG